MNWKTPNHSAQYAPSGQGRAKQRRAPGAGRYVTLERVVRISKLIFTLTLLCVSPAHSEEELPLCGADVIQNKAVFYFPILYEDHWQWYREETANDQLEYSWEVAIPANDPVYSLGVYLFKFAGLKPHSGTLEELLRYAQKTAAKVKNEGAYSTFTTDEHLEVRAGVKEQGVIVGIVDDKTFQMIMAGRPEEAMFRIRHPDPESSITCKGAIRYISSAGDITTAPSAPLSGLGPR